MSLSSSFVRVYGKKVFELHCYNNAATYMPWDDANYEQGVIDQGDPESDGSFVAEFIDGSFARWDNSSLLWQDVEEAVEIEVE